MSTIEIKDGMAMVFDYQKEILRVPFVETDDILEITNIPETSEKSAYLNLTETILNLEEFARGKGKRGLVIRKSAKASEHDDAVRFMLERGFCIPDVDEYILTIDLAKVSKSYIMSIDCDINSIDPANRMKKTLSFSSNIPETDEKIVDAFSFTLMDAQKPGNADICALYTEKDDVLIQEHFDMDSDGANGELIPYFKLILTAIINSNRHKTLRIQAESFVQYQLFKKLFDGAIIGEEKLLGAYKFI